MNCPFARWRYNSAIRLQLFRVLFSFLSVLLVNITALKAANQPPFPDYCVLWKAPSIIIDGGIEDWTSHPFTVLGCNSIDEDKLCAQVRSGWSTVGLLVSVRALQNSLDKQQGRMESQSIEIFFDGREQGAQMNTYEVGVSHLLVEHSLSLSAPTIWKIKSPGGKTRELSVTCQWNKAKDGWFAEIIIPWETLDMPSPPKVGTWAALSVRLRQRGEGSTKIVDIGAESPESRSQIDETPIAFMPCLIADRPQKAGAFSYAVEEVITQTSTEIRFQAIVPANDADMTGRQLELRDKRGVVMASKKFSKSVAGVFWIAEGVALVQDVKTELTEVCIQIDDESWKQFVLVKSSGSMRMCALSRALVTASLHITSEAELLASLLEECAKEIVATVPFARDGKRANQRRFRAVHGCDAADERIGVYVKACNMIRTIGVIPKGYPYRAFRSVNDGALIPVKIVYPWGFNFEKTWPATCVIYGRSLWQSRSDFMEFDLRSFEAGNLPNNAGQGFTFILYGRGNSHIEFADEEIDHLFSAEFSRLNIDPKRVGIYGGSYGASAVLKMATRRPGKFAWVYGRSGTYNSLVSADTENTQGYSKFFNLSGSHIYLVSGSKDIESAEGTKILAKALTDQEISVIVDIVPGKGHYFSPPPPPRTISDAFLSHHPKGVSFTTSEPQYCTAYWLRIDQFVDWSKPATIKGSVSLHEIRISFSNVDSFTVDLSAFDAFSYPIRVTYGTNNYIDLARPVNGNTLSVSISGRHLSSPAVPVKLTTTICGPSSQILKGPIIIVYGTKNESASLLMQQRAQRVLEEITGTNPGQMSVANLKIKADVDVNESDRSSCNLWLIGGVNDNFLSCVMADMFKKVNVSLPSTDLNRSHKRDSLLSYIFPSPFSIVRCLYIEDGSSNIAYLASVLPMPSRDVCWQELGSAGFRVRRFEDFSSAWSLRK